MKTDRLFEFSVDKENNRIHIKREFDANLKQVWQAWTEPKLLDQWWAPKPYRLETKSMDFQEGGQWLYAMISPKNEKHWCKADYKTIKLLESISWLDAFCDEHGNETSGKPRSLWTNVFKENDGTTTVTISLQHDDYSDIEMIIQMGFKEGFTMALENLDELLSALKAN